MHLSRSHLARQLGVDFEAADGATSVLDYQVHLGLLSLEQLRVGEAAGDFYLHWTRIHEAVDSDKAKQRDSQQQQLQVVDEGREEHQDGPETSVGDRLAGPHLYVFDRDRWHLYRGQELCQYLLWLDATDARLWLQYQPVAQYRDDRALDVVRNDVVSPRKQSQSAREFEQAEASTRA